MGRWVRSPWLLASGWKHHKTHALPASRAPVVPAALGDDLSPHFHSLTVSSVEELVTFQRPFGFELLATHVAEVGFLGAVTVHVSLQVALAASRVLTQGALEGLHTCQRREDTRAHLRIHGCPCRLLPERPAHSPSWCPDGSPSAASSDLLKDILPYRHARSLQLPSRRPSHGAPW